ncbi:GNAT family N-acetyltransferase [Malaciobacter mytili]|uniref:GNAT family N-acetyltransferase n=1 Tax=Malaciobacter mytili LMG 24559 TaxID=1032238 RepID=A0AAX2AKA3_9BACT|nr:GNAT family N-acetyltransferase [Malaciobacter mytili]AXH14394.1 acetyltransferase [Malaciobacter mytili LMG 24559]RXI37402.1 GNAT family N-acetyltransferase [Malaciobacter mytili]RXK16031.1 GNAT family N-acetyltransferase [Malaciobacter mytili LMG 24559]
MQYLILDENNIENEHICCGFSDKKCSEGYKAKKTWLKLQFKNNFIFQKLDKRAKVFMETIPLKDAWVPLENSNYLFIGCFWVSGKYKNQGHGKKLLQEAIKRAKKDSFDGLVTIVGKKKFHFMSDTKWLLKNGFEVVEETTDGFVILGLKINKKPFNIKIKECVKNREITKKGVVVYYSNRCVYSEVYILTSLKEVCKKNNIPLEINKLDTLQKAQNSPTLATIFSLFYNAEFITTDISVCLESKFTKLLKL